jgi:hypothetical protein
VSEGIIGEQETLKLSSHHLTCVNPEKKNAALRKIVSISICKATGAEGHGITCTSGS